MKKTKTHIIPKKRKNFLLWFFLVMALLFSGLSAYGLRSNNLKAIELRDALLETDKANGDIEGSLRTLRSYIYSHMNTNLSSGTNLQFPIQLKYRYERLVAAEKARADEVNKKIYADAQSYCEQKFGGASLKDQRVPCVQQYVSENSVKEQNIADDLYKFSFVAPVWSPDLAGFSLVLAVLFFCLFISEIVLRHIIKLRQRSDF